MVTWRPCDDLVTWLQTIWQLPPKLGGLSQPLGFAKMDPEAADAPSANNLQDWLAVGVRVEHVRDACNSQGAPFCNQHRCLFRVYFAALYLSWYTKKWWKMFFFAMLASGQCCTSLDRVRCQKLSFAAGVSSLSNVINAWWLLAPRTTRQPQL